MACSFAYREDSCGCHIGYQLPLKTEADQDVTNYPVMVINVNGVNLSEASSPSEYVSIWNSNAANQAVGVLSVGNGAYCFNLSRILGVIPPSSVLGFYEAPVPVELTVRYGFTELDTTGTPPTEQNFIDSIATGTELTQAFIAGAAEIAIANFGNATDKVLYVVAPVGEAAFTKWSVVGDALQQNLSIDQTFAGSNVWFKSGNNYFTKAQTSFSGTLRLHR